MTTVSVNKRDGNIEMVCRGHSGYANSGADIVCSAISILGYSLCQLLFELEAEHRLSVTEYGQSDGSQSITIYDPADESDQAFRMFRIGIQALADQYPENVEFFWGEFSN